MLYLTVYAVMTWTVLSQIAGVYQWFQGNHCPLRIKLEDLVRGSKGNYKKAKLVFVLFYILICTTMVAVVVSAVKVGNRIPFYDELLLGITGLSVLLGGVLIYVGLEVLDTMER